MASAAESAAHGDLDALASALVLFMKASGAGEEAARGFAERAHRLTAGLFDSSVRDECLDTEGIAGEILYPDGFVENHPPFSDAPDGPFHSSPSGYPFALRLAGARAYNRWLADFCAEAPERRLGAILLPPANDVAAVVEEMVRARESGLRGGALIPPLAPGLPGYQDALYDPVWAAAADLGLPIAVHGGNAKAPDAQVVFGTEEPLASVFHFTECAFFDRRPLWQFIWGGVFDRHPKLKLVFAEALAHWVPQEILRLDEMYDMWNLKSLRERLRLRPSAYWQQNCAITATFPSRAEVGMREEIGPRNMLWGSDFPHPEGTWPYTRTCQKHAFQGVPVEQAALLLGSNALDLYDFDRMALQRLADRIGPRAQDIITAPDVLPVNYVGMGLR
jgi:predicted TIM-barrel fold metal-dependent hydrolase